MFSDSMVYECSEFVGCYLGVNPPNAALESIANDFIRLRTFMDRRSLIDCVRQPSKDAKFEAARINFHFFAAHEQLGHPIERGFEPSAPSAVAVSAGFADDEADEDGALFDFFAVHEQLGCHLIESRERGSEPSAPSVAASAEPADDEADEARALPDGLRFKRGLSSYLQPLDSNYHRRVHGQLLAAAPSSSSSSSSATATVGLLPMCIEFKRYTFVRG